MSNFENEREWKHYHRLIGKETALSEALVLLREERNKVLIELTRVYNESNHPEIVSMRSRRLSDYEKR